MRLRVLPPRCHQKGFSGVSRGVGSSRSRFPSVVRGSCMPLSEISESGTMIDVRETFADARRRPEITKSPKGERWRQMPMLNLADSARIALCSSPMVATNGWTMEEDRSCHTASP
jgi:hypothetical protein